AAPRLALDGGRQLAGVDRRLAPHQPPQVGHGASLRRPFYRAVAGPSPRRYTAHRPAYRPPPNGPPHAPTPLPRPPRFPRPPHPRPPRRLAAVARPGPRRGLAREGPPRPPARQADAPLEAAHRRRLRRRRRPRRPGLPPGPPGRPARGRAR